MTDVRAADKTQSCWETPMSPERRRRLRQVLRYLEAHWPAAHPVRLQVCRISDRHETLAILEEVEGHLRIRIDNRTCYYHALDLLFHEYSHAVTWRVVGPHHGGAWAGTYAEILTAVEDGDLLEDSLAW